MTALQPYPVYKDSGIDWLGEVPEHWEVRRLKTLAHMQSGDTITAMSIDETGQHPVYGGNGLRGYTSSYTHDGDFVLIGRQGALCGNVHLVRGRFWASEHAVVATLHVGHVPYWFGALLRGMNLNQYSIAAAQPGLSVDRILNLWAPVPPKLEQTAIARFLDRADRRIRRYIRAKERLIKLLEEQKQAIIHEAVTGQIDVQTGQPYPAYKDSGAAWLGDIPEHWERRRLKTLLRAVDHRSATGEETLLSLRRDHGIVVYSEHFARPSQGQTLVGYKLVAAGQLVVNRLQANNGLIFCSDIDGLVSPDYSVFEARIPFRMDYLEELLRTSTYRAYFRRVARGLGTGTAGFLRLYDGTLLATTVHLPPEREQKLICDWIVQHVARLEDATGRLLRELQLIDEYRTRLIADAVTGKLDVREAAARLPEADPSGVESRSAAVHTESNLHASERDIAKEAGA
ncbi:restriction endonuclease subunit S [Candidatus Palauibacter sp.]|uniref:restriction endonuclease subunit S n=1 Tax=Candidatus Palauibacter sp. TaxID=3101350 RepID=UPI003B59680F